MQQNLIQDPSQNATQDSEQNITRYIELNNWIFEIKSIRAIKVEKYGDPYNATANLCINNDHAFVDGVMTRDQMDLDEEDHLTFMALCQKLGVSKVKFDKFSEQNIFGKQVDERTVRTA